MDKNAIKKYAVWARKELIARVSQKAQQYGITSEGYGDKNADSINGVLLTATEKKQRQALIAKIDAEGFEQVMEEVAYTWFNRFTALRFMEVNNFLPSHTRVFTNEENEFKPQILADAISLEIEGLDMEKVFELKNANKDEELYKYLLIVQCNALSGILPRMFQKIADYTELLLPDYLLREGSVIEQMVALIPENDWTDQVQIIGWLYQYYNSEKKDDVFAALKKNVKITKENIPAATQLFTPDWIVRYMVENSLGRLWVEGHPNDELKAQWKYYLEEAEQEQEVQAQLAEIRKEYSKINPEEIKCIDPCCGSGHILAYMFDILVQIYEAYGYTSREAVASIVENNIYGLDIDERAAQLASFAVMMKARQYDRRFFSRGIQPRVYAIVESNQISEYVVDYFVNGDMKIKEAIGSIMEEMRDAKEYGSILNIAPVEFEALYQRVEEVKEVASMFQNETLETILPLIQVAEALAMKYHCVVTNPPYMGGSGMSNVLANYVKKNYPNSKSDLFAVFIERGNGMLFKNGFNSMVTMQSWMFLSSFEKMRLNTLDTNTITNLMHMENMVMGIAFGTAVTVFRKNNIKAYKGTYNHIKYENIVDSAPYEFPVKNNRFAQVSTDNFSKIPGSPIAYWVSEKIIYAFSAYKSLRDLCAVKNGMSTTDNNRFLRQWYECDIDKIGLSMTDAEEATLSRKKWFPYNKGGEFRKYYGNISLVVNWEFNGKEIKKAAEGASGGRIVSQEYYFMPSLSWSKVTAGQFVLRYFPRGFLFDVAGPSIFADYETQKYVMGLMNSKVKIQLLDDLYPTINYEMGQVSSTPINFEQSRKEKVCLIVQENIDISKIDWDSFETSWDFKCHPLISVIPKNRFLFDDISNIDMAECFMCWENECNDSFNRIKANEEDLNRIFIDIYGLQEELTPEVEDKDITVRKADLPRDVKSFISYAVGCMFGRYNLGYDGLAYAGGEWDSSKYTTFKADKDNIIPICDDEYFEDDIVARFIDFVRTVYGEKSLEENLRFIADALGGKGQPKEVIRNYFINGFYADHCKIYQKRPIYWLFDSGKKNGFKALIYMHRYQPDTIARIRTDYVHEQQSRYRTAMEELEQRVLSASTSERVKLNKHLKALQEQAAEIQGYEEKIHHLADQMISIDLDDGVKTNYAKFQDVLAKIK